MQKWEGQVKCYSNSGERRKARDSKGRDGSLVMVTLNYNGKCWLIRAGKEIFSGSGKEHRQLGCKVKFMSWLPTRTSQETRQSANPTLMKSIYFPDSLERLISQLPPPSFSPPPQRATLLHSETSSSPFTHPSLHSATHSSLPSLFVNRENTVF